MAAIASGRAGAARPVACGRTAPWPGRARAASSSSSAGAAKPGEPRSKPPDSLAATCSAEAAKQRPVRREVASRRPGNSGKTRCDWSWWRTGTPSQPAARRQNSRLGLLVQARTRRTWVPAKQPAARTRQRRAQAATQQRACQGGRVDRIGIIRARGSRCGVALPPAPKNQAGLRTASNKAEAWGSRGRDQENGRRSQEERERRFPWATAVRPERGRGSSAGMPAR